jgi:hypothetical protein
MPGFLLLFFAEIRDSKAFAYFSGKLVGNFGVSRYRLYRTIHGVHPKRMRSPFSLEVATIPT